MTATPDMESKDNPYTELVCCDTDNATTIDWKNWQNDEYWPGDYLYGDKKVYYGHLDRQNSGLQNGPKYQNKSYETYKINRHLVMCIGGRLNMGDWGKKRATSLLVGLLRSNMGLKSGLVAFCTCAYVIEEYQDGRRAHPQVNQSERDPLVESQREELNISQSQFSSTYGKVAHRVKNRDLDLPRHDRYNIDEHLSGLDADLTNQPWKVR